MNQNTTQPAEFDRELLRGSLDLMVLSNLSSVQQYGYQILANLREASGGRVNLKAGTLYPILHKLEAEGCVRSWWEDSTGRDRKWYALTEKGARRLANDAREWTHYADCVRRMLRPIVDAVAPPAANEAKPATPSVADAGA